MAQDIQDRVRHAPVRADHVHDLRDALALTVMAHPPVCIDADFALDTALRTLATTGVRHLAVVDSDGRCVGMVSDRVVTAQWAWHPITFDTVRVADVCGTAAVVDDQASLAEVARAMRRHGTDAVVVVDAEEFPLGIVTTSDIVALLAKPRPA